MKGFGFVIEFCVYKTIHKKGQFVFSFTDSVPPMCVGRLGRLEQEGNDSKLFNKTGFAQIVWA